MLRHVFLKTRSAEFRDATAADDSDAWPLLKTSAAERPKLVLQAITIYDITTSRPKLVLQAITIYAITMSCCSSAPPTPSSRSRRPSAIFFFSEQFQSAQSPK